MAGIKSPIVTLTPSPTLDRTYFVKHLVEDIGGNMSIDSTMGEGATFIIKLPIKP